MTQTRPPKKLVRGETMAASFSGRYAEAAKAKDPVPKPEGPPPVGNPKMKDNIPPTKVVSSKGVPTGAASQDEDDNPYLKDSPYYLASLKDKAEDAKAEILVTMQLKKKEKRKKFHFHVNSLVAQIQKNK
jgi:curli biogenesis system outer membrane secretion channel CsgG